MPTRLTQRYEKFGIFLSFCIFLTTILQGQPLGLQPEMELNYGLRHNSVRAIVQDKQDLTFIGTESGLIILGAHNAFLDTIIKQSENLPIVSLNVWKRFLFIGTVANGLKIYDLEKRKRIYTPLMDSIRYVRRIRLINNQIYIAANSSSWKVTLQNNQLLLTKIWKPGNKGFFTDFVGYEGRIMMYDLKSEDQSRPFELNKNIAVSIPYPAGFPPNPIYSMLTGYSNDSIYISAGDGFYNIISKSKKPIFQHLIDEKANLYYPVWEIALAKQKIFLALGQQYQLKMGLTYEVGTNTLKDIRNDFFCQSLYYNPKHDALWIGTYNRGMFIWPKVSLSTKLPVIDEPIERVIKSNSSDTYLYNKRKIYKWKQDGSINLLGNKNYDKDILEVRQKKDTLAVLRTNSLMFFDKNDKIISTYLFNDNRFGTYSEIGDSIFFFTRHNTGIQSTHKDTKKFTLLNDISIGPISKQYKNGFLYFSDEKGFYYHDSSTIPLKSPLTKIQEFEILGDNLWVLIAGRIIKYKINLKTATLEEINNISYPELVKGFTPNWIRVCSNKLYTGNNKGVFKIDTLSANPEWYSYLGNYKSNLNPEVLNDTLYMIQDYYLEKHPLIQPYEKESINTFDLTIDNKGLLYARFPFILQAKHKDYFLQNYALKRLELLLPSGKKEVYFGMDGNFQFPSGLLKGKYEATLFVNNIRVKKIEFNITVPLLQNPYFYTFLASLIIFIFYQFFRLRNKRQELERNMLENRLQLLKKNLDPHFIFNSLNLTYMLLLEEKNKEAIDSIMRFSELHRYFLEIINKKEIPLEEEIKFIEHYLELEQKRVHLDAPFNYTISYKNELVPEILIPPMILHPLVENAVKYCGYDHNLLNESAISITILNTNQQTIIAIENTLDPNNLPSTVGFKRGLEIVQETITIYNKMANNYIEFKANTTPLLFHPGYRCEIIITH